MKIEKGKGQRLYKKAKQIIPGGTMLLSKRPEMFLPENWPSYFSSCDGISVKDLDGNIYLDMSIMGIGTNILGYRNKIIDDAVRNVISNGNMSTLNCPEEVYLAEKLIELNPWADMVRFARTGGEANAIAIRIARAASGRDKVAICGYHGWHDWYLATNLESDRNLNNHLLPGLNPKGVPKSLVGSVFPFEYNDFESLKKIVDENKIGVIKMEVVRNENPKNNFLDKVRALASKKNIVLVFDECTTGFRETYGGIYKKYKVNPDIVIYGKALGNGYSITSVVGKKQIMESAQKTFISSTFWTERIGPVAALKTLETMEKTSSWEIITQNGNIMRKGWNELAKKYDLEIVISGIPSLSNFRFNSENNQAYMTFITQEMMKYGYLSSGRFYPCIKHNEKNISKYLEFLEIILEKIKKCEKKGSNINNLLDGPICHSGFKRLN